MQSVKIMVNYILLRKIKKGTKSLLLTDNELL